MPSCLPLIDTRRSGSPHREIPRAIVASLVSVGFALSFSGLGLLVLAAGVTLLSARLRRL